MTDAAGTPTAALAGRRVVLGVSGGIAAYKAVLVARLLVTAGAQVDTILTRGASHFVGAATFEGITGRPCRSEVWDDIPSETHVALGRAADLVVVYPATAHLLARLATGLADDLLTTTLLVARCPVVLAPAMHTEMWDHPATQANARLLTERGVVLAGPAVGELMGGDRGAGRAVEPDEVVASSLSALSVFAAPARDGDDAVGDHDPEQDLHGVTVVVTAGGTREPIDPVRFLGNRSTGKMGFALAAEAARRGATTHLVAAPTSLATPDGVKRHDVVTARDMHTAVFGLAADADVVVKAAAVADYRPNVVAAHKIKKATGVPTIELVRNPDILADLGRHRADTDATRPILVGFAAETDDVVANGRAKLARKGVDLLLVNDVGTADAGFAVDTNRGILLTADGREIEIAHSSKRAVAARLWDEIVRLLG